MSALNGVFENLQKQVEAQFNDKIKIYEETYRLQEDLLRDSLIIMMDLILDDSIEDKSTYLQTEWVNHEAWSELGRLRALIGLDDINIGDEEVDGGENPAIDTEVYRRRVARPLDTDAPISLDETGSV